MVDRDLLDAMLNAIAGLSMPLTSHQQIQNIIANVMREAEARAAKAKQEPNDAKS